MRLPALIATIAVTVGIPTCALASNWTDTAGHITDITAFIQFARAADAIYVADVVGVDAAPGFWSGYIDAYQTVRYRFVETIVKHPSWDVPPELDVQFLIVQGSPWVQEDKPALQTGMFEVGQRHLVLFLPPTDAGTDGERFARVEDRASVVVFKWTEPSQ